MILADTTFIIDLINSDRGVIAKAKLIDEGQIMTFISSITVQEFLRGIYLKFHSDRELSNFTMIFSSRSSKDSILVNVVKII